MGEVKIMNRLQRIGEGATEIYSGGGWNFTVTRSRYFGETVLVTILHYPYKSYYFIPGPRADMPPLGWEYFAEKFALPTEVDCAIVGQMICEVIGREFRGFN